MPLTIARSLDLTGFACPLPIVKAARALGELASGELIEVFATDPGTVPDFAAWARATGHELVESARIGATFHFVLRKR